MTKRTFIFILLFFCLQIYNVKSVKAFYPEETFFSENEIDYFIHTVERGQTLYSIANMYQVSVEAIQSLNPGSENGIREGSILKIPQESGSYVYHTIQPKETLYSLAKQYYMKGEDIISVNPGLSVETFQTGKIIRIPTNLVTTPIENGNETINSINTNRLLYQTETSGRMQTVKIALLLPFGLKKSPIHNRFVEYYEGFLLALQDIKRKGISVNLQVHDLGTEKEEILAILSKPEMQNIELLIGGLSDLQIKLMSQFSKEKNIPYVIPIVSTSNEVSNNENIFQVNTPQSFLYSKASLAFINKYKENRIIIIKDQSSKSNRIEFINVLEADLKQRNIDYSTLTYSGKIASELLPLLDKDKSNVIIPSDDSAETLTKIISPLKLIADTRPELMVSLFGYPYWQVYSTDFSEDFFRLNVSFYTFFYADPTSPEVKSFYNTFYKWYSRNMNSFPKYGILGYDTGRFFIEAVHAYGTNLGYKVNDVRFNGIQTDFYFERVNNWGGFINTNMYIVDFNPDYSITKTCIK